MATINFQPTLREIRDVLKSDYYTIPRFQRPYSWSTENLDDFWNDVIKDNPEGYFIGPMVCYSVGKGTYGIVDGQQRITTLTLTICALRDLFIELGEGALADGISQYIERKDDDSESHYVLSSEAAGNYLKSQIQVAPPRMYQEDVNDEQKALLRAYADIKARLSDEIEGISLEGAEGSVSPAAASLKSIRDRVLSLQAIWIQLDNEDDAYVIFETLNSRGKDLETVDLLKNLLLGAIRQENGDLDTARIRWNSMRNRLAAAGTTANPNKFLLHWWLSRNEYTAERKLFRLMKRKFDRSQAEELLVNLELRASTYAKIANPDAWVCKAIEAPVRDSLKALNLFGVRQPRPFLLALLAAYEDGRVKLKKVRTVFSAIENYHFVTTAVVGVSSTGGISQMYASHARDVTNTADADELNSSIDLLVAKLRDKISTREQFVAAFDRSLYFSEEHASEKRLVQYALRRLHDHAVPGVPTDHSKCNIEHIEPQSSGTDWCSRMGNLLWIDSSLNHSMSDLGFTEKKKEFVRHSTILDVADVVSCDVWTEIEVSQRGLRMAGDAYDAVWNF